MTQEGEKEPESPGGTPASGSGTSEIGAILALRYEVVRELGRGGMGVVYLCRDLVTGERVALKRLRSPEETKRSRPEEQLVVPAGGARGRGARPPGDRACARLRHARRRLALPRDGRAPWAERPRVDAHDDAPLVGHLGDRRSGARRARARARARSHPRRSQAVQRDARSRVDCARTARLRPRPRARLAPRSSGTTRGSTARRAPEPARALGGGDGRAGSRPSRSASSRRTSGRRPISTRSAASSTASSPARRSSKGTRRTFFARTSGTRSRRRDSRKACRPGSAPFVVRLLAKKPWHRLEFAADARRAWLVFRPTHSPTLEETVGGPITSRPAPPSQPAAVAAARSLAAGIMSMRPSPMIARERRTAAGHAGRRRGLRGHRRAASAARAHRRGRGRQEPPRRVAQRAGARDGARWSRCARATAVRRRRSTASPAR